MKGLEKRHPLSVFFWFLFVALVPVLAFHPVILGISFLGSLLFDSLVPRERQGRSRWWMAVLLLLFVILNPLFNSDGETLLFFVNDRAVTGESLFFGLLSGLGVVGMLHWFLAFSRFMTADQWFCVLRFAGKRFALLFTMVMRFVPLLSRRLHQIRQAQRGLGLYKEDDVLLKLKSEARVLSALATWALENGIVTADSMEARGYGSGARTVFTRRRFGTWDAVFVFSVFVFGVAGGVSLSLGAFSFSCFPCIVLSGPGLGELWLTFIYSVFVFLPGILALLEEVKWSFLHRRP